MKIYSFNSIKKIDSEKIFFSDGFTLTFSDCINGFYNHYKNFTNKTTCVAERKINEQQPFFNFYTEGEEIKIIFDCRNFFAKSRNIKNFLFFQNNITKLGYKTFDLT